MGRLRPPVQASLQEPAADSQTLAKSATASRSAAGSASGPNFLFEYIANEDRHRFTASAPGSEGAGFRPQVRFQNGDSANGDSAKEIVSFNGLKSVTTSWLSCCRTSIIFCVKSTTGRRSEESGTHRARAAPLSHWLVRLPI